MDGVRRVLSHLGDPCARPAVDGLGQMLSRVRVAHARADTRSCHGRTLTGSRGSNGNGAVALKAGNKNQRQWLASGIPAVACALRCGVETVQPQPCTGRDARVVQLQRVRPDDLQGDIAAQHHRGISPDGDAAGGESSPQVSERLQQPTGEVA